MHVLLTVNTAWNIWNFRKPVVQSLLSNGHRVTVLAPPDEAVADLVDLGCVFVPLEMNAKGLNPVDEVRLWQRLRRQFRADQPDVILSYTIKNNIFGALAAKSLGIPFLPNVSGLGTGFLSGGALQFVVEQLYKRAFRNLPAVFFQNEDDQNMFIARNLVTPSQTRLLPGSGIDLNHFAPKPLPSGKPPIFLMIARLLRDKGVFEFVEAARSIRATDPSIRFQLLGAAGSDNRSAISMDTVTGWVNEGTIEYLGTTKDVRPAIEAATCVVLPSYREGAPRTLIEAASIARPLIATDVPGCRSVVDNNVNGYLCAVQNAQSLTEAMHRFLALSPTEQSALGLAGRAKMEREFDQALVIQSYFEAIRAVTGQTV